ncbi:hypothetical protein ACWGLE_22845 [Streptomyces sp. NPDC055897]
MEDLAVESGSPKVRAGATEALTGDAARVKAFLDAGQYQVIADDLRLYITQIISAGGPVTKDTGRAALNSENIETYRTFLNTGQFAARTEDDRVRATQLISVGGPELKAAARIALEGPADLLHSFIQAEQYKAQRKDQLTATHVAQVQQLISEAARIAATAQQNAAEAGKAAATARKASAEADRYANQARDSQREAQDYADKAAQSAKDAETSAANAAASARTGRQAEADAQRAATRAVNSAVDASVSADVARSSANRAWAAADQARASATAAGKDAEAAGKAATEAFAEAVAKQREEAAKWRQARDAWENEYGEDEPDEKNEGWIPDWLQDKVNTFGDYAEAILTNSDVWIGAGESALGVVMMVGGAGGDVAGAAVCLTGVGCLAGAPAIAAMSGLIVGGGYTAADGVGRFSDGFGQALREAKDSSGSSVNWNPNSVKTYQHTFKTHGQKNSTQRMADLARGKKQPQGQWLDDKAAAAILEKNHTGSTNPLDAYEVEIPPGVGRVALRTEPRSPRRTPVWYLAVPATTRQHSRS